MEPELRKVLTVSPWAELWDQTTRYHLEEICADIERWGEGLPAPATGPVRYSIEPLLDPAVLRGARFDEHESAKHMFTCPKEFAQCRRDVLWREEYEKANNVFMTLPEARVMCQYKYSGVHAEEWLRAHVITARAPDPHVVNLLVATAAAHAPDPDLGLLAALQLTYGDPGAACSLLQRYLKDTNRAWPFKDDRVRLRLLAEWPFAGRPVSPLPESTCLAYMRLREPLTDPAELLRFADGALEPPLTATTTVFDIMNRAKMLRYARSLLFDPYSSDSLESVSYVGRLLRCTQEGLSRRQNFTDYPELLATTAMLCMITLGTPWCTEVYAALRSFDRGAFAQFLTDIGVPEERRARLAASAEFILREED